MKIVAAAMLSLIWLSSAHAGIFGESAAEHVARLKRRADALDITIGQYQTLMHRFTSQGVSEDKAFEAMYRLHKNVQAAVGAVEARRQQRDPFNTGVRVHRGGEGF